MGEGRAGQERDSALHIHATTEVRGAVLPPYFVALLLIFLVLSSAGTLFLWSELDETERELRLLEDFVEGRIGDLPYRPGDPDHEP